MANPLFGGGSMPQAPMNPLQQAGMFMQALRDPAGFVRQMVPDLPADISNDPNRVLQYLQQTRGFTNEQIQQASMMTPQGVLSQMSGGSPFGRSW